MEPSSPPPSNEGTAEDRRESPRRKKQIKVLLSDAEVQTPPTAAWVVDRSLGGLCLSVNQEVTPGTVLSVRPATAEVPWVPIEVKSCRPVENTWELGCQFLRAPSYSVLMQFG